MKRSSIGFSSLLVALAVTFASSAFASMDPPACGGEKGSSTPKPEPKPQPKPPSLE
jgi:hypothetical protein